MNRKLKAINWVVRQVMQIVCRVYPNEFSKIPKNGPLILVGNHINFLEAPVMLPFLDNPNVIGVAKRESWDNPLFNFLFNEWKVIPIEREMVDRDAFANILEALAQDKVLAIFPEGTRSKNGNLLKGKPGVVAIAAKSKAPIIPISFYGYENFWDNLKHFRKTEFHVAVGEPFRLNLNGNSLSKDVREEVTDEIMYKIAELLPGKYLINYPDVHQKTYKYVAASS
jgi:1-acyl-sn-glycerol-3-phosphate acyltransferase